LPDQTERVLRFLRSPAVRGSRNGQP
jgi:hypothetical protein